MTQFNAESTALLTGATGLIGGEIAQLIGQRVKTVACLTRKKLHSSAENRLNRRFLQSSLNPIKVRAVPGDLNIENLGLEPTDSTSLSQSVDVVIHCAAETSFLHSESCQQTNVKGTQNLLEFAHRCKKKPLIIYVSTACNSGKISAKSLSEEDGCHPENEHHNEYTRTKAIAEKLVRASHLQTIVLRPSIVLGNGIRNRTLAQQILWFCPLMKEFEALPFEPSARLDIVPVSFVREVIDRLFLNRTPQHRIYNISSGNSSLKVEDWSRIVGEYYNRKTALKLIPPSEWGKQEHNSFVKTDLQRKIFFALKFYLPFINMDLVFDNSRINRELGGVQIPDPSSYLHDILGQIQWKEALVESQSP